MDVNDGRSSIYLNGKAKDYVAGQPFSYFDIHNNEKVSS